MSEPDVYVPRRQAVSEFHPVRGWRLHLHRWGDASLAAPERPPLVLLHGWMDVGASFQFLVDALAAAEGFARLVIAPDARGFGRSDAPAPVDAYWFPDYLGDLDALLDRLAPDTPVDLLGHSMGGNVVMAYAGVRPGRIRRLVNLEGFGLPDAPAAEAPARLARWLDELKQPQRLRDYASLADVAGRLRENHPRLAPDRAAWLAPHWARQDTAGRWQIQGDPAHKRVNPVPYRRDEAVAGWRAIQAPLLWLEGADTDVTRWWGDRYPRADFERRLAEVPRVQRATLTDCGHMLHLDQPEALAAHLTRFLG